MMGAPAVSPEVGAGPQGSLRAQQDTSPSLLLGSSVQVGSRP